MIVRLRFNGRIEAITPETGGSRASVEGMLRTKSGVVQSFKLNRNDRVFRQTPGYRPASRPPRSQTRQGR